MKRTIIIVFCLFFLHLTGAMASSLSPTAQVSLITCGPGEEIFEVFGHTAIRIYDPERHMDVAYNYGVFDFDRPDFYANFAKGHLVYMLGAEDYKNFLDYYTSYNRSVTEQVLDLSLLQKQALYDYLENNMLPQNREYVYDYFFNNCSTKPRDIIQLVTKNQIIFDYSYAKGSHYSIRQLIDQCATEDSWGDLGIDIALGSATDATMTPYEYMYVPGYLLKAFNLAKVNENGVQRPLVKRTINWYTPKPVPTITDWTSPMHVFWAFFVLVAIYTGIFLFIGKPGYGLDIILFGLSGVVGFILVYISGFTDHHSGANYNLMWLFPLNLFAGILLQFKSLRTAMRYYFAAGAFVILVLLCLFNFLPQTLNYTTIPLMLVLLVRCLNVMYNERKEA